MEDKFSYASKNIFSQCNSIWSKYEVKKPRLPTLQELQSNAKRWIDDPGNRPSSFSLYIGVHNIELSRALLRICQDFADSNNLPTVVLLSGAGGKAGMMK